MSISRENLKAFARYEKYWRCVLVEVLSWPEEAFVEFVARRKEWLRSDGDEFFYDYASKYLYPVLIPVRLRDVLSGGFDVQAAGLVKRAMKLPPHSIADLDVAQARESYSKIIRRLDRLAAKARGRKQSRRRPTEGKRKRPRVRH